LNNQRLSLVQEKLMLNSCLIIGWELYLKTVDMAKL